MLNAVIARELTKEIGADASIRHRIGTFEGREEELVNDVPLSEYPGLKNFQVPVTRYTQVGTLFTIPKVTVQNAQGLNVGYAGLDDLITTDQEWKNKL